MSDRCSELVVRIGVTVQSCNVYLTRICKLNEELFRNFEYIRGPYALFSFNFGVLVTVS